MKNKFTIITAICILSAVFIGAAYHYIRPNVGLDDSKFTSLRKKARSEPRTIHSRQINPESLHAVTAQPSLEKGQIDPWHDVRVLLVGADIHLTDSEIALLQTRYADLVHDRETLELALAKKQRIDDTKILITIPTYTDAGTELYANFIRDVTADFGVSRADQVLNVLDHSIIACNFGLGQQPQVILAEDQQSQLKISRGRSAVSITIDGTETKMPEIKATGFYERNELNAFEYLKPLLLSKN